MLQKVIPLLNTYDEGLNNGQAIKDHWDVRPERYGGEYGVFTAIIIPGRGLIEVRVFN